MAAEPFTRTLLTELCVAELEEVTGESNGIHHLNRWSFFSPFLRSPIATVEIGKMERNPFCCGTAAWAWVWASRSRWCKSRRTLTRTT